MKIKRKRSKILTSVGMFCLFLGCVVLVCLCGCKSAAQWEHIYQSEAQKSAESQGMDSTEESTFKSSAFNSLASGNLISEVLISESLISGGLESGEEKVDAPKHDKSQTEEGGSAVLNHTGLDAADFLVPEGYVQVHVCGAVASPGVYALPCGARVKQAIDAAGGMTEEADELLLNQARIIEDGEQIRVYTKEEVSQGAAVQKNAGGSATDTGGKININHADSTVLMTLPGIGESKARAIIAYRESKGNFSSIEDIMNIPGIKEAVFSQIQDLITV